MTRPVLQVVLVLVAAVAALAPIPPAAVEAIFSTGIYPRIQPVVTGLSNAAPFAVFDLLLIAAATTVVVVLVRGIRAARASRKLLPLARSLATLASVAAVVYLAFLLLWGLNYRRIPMSERIELRPGRPSQDAVLELARRATGELNALHPRAHEAGWIDDETQDQALRRAFAEVQGFLADARRVEPGRLKWTMLAPYFRWTGVDGMIDPFALEVLGNSDLLPFERPFVAAHEWAHLAGYADESEASFVGWLTCVRASVSSQYSGWLSLFWQLSGELGQKERASVVAALAPGPRRDIEAIADRLRRGQLPALRRASWAVYDQYLKANRVEEGVRSYSLVVTLLIQANFDEGWVPRRVAAGPRGVAAGPKGPALRR